eukprot:5317311-Ditylum_brightwellii.AAC.1
MYNQDGTEKVVTHTITEQKELEKACMKEVDRRSITDYADKILWGIAQHLDGVDEYTQLYLDQLRA